MDAKFSDAHALGHEGIVHLKVIFQSVTLSRDRATTNGLKIKQNIWAGVGVYIQSMKFK